MSFAPVFDEQPTAVSRYELPACAPTVILETCKTCTKGLVPLAMIISNTGQLQ